jgi:hypothetical protein
MKIEPGRSGLPNLALDHWSMNTFLLIEVSVLFVRVRSSSFIEGAFCCRSPLRWVSASAIIPIAKASRLRGTAQPGR